MALTFRANGNSAQNQITAAWFNDFYNLLTGVMTDQKVTIANTVIIKATGPSPSTGANGTLAAGTNLGIGNYVYVYTYANADGETKISPTFSITTTSGNRKVNLTGITIGATGTTKRNIYRTAVGGGTVYKFAGSINDNLTTTYSDTLVDGSLGALAPTTFTFGGTIILEDSTGVPTFKVTNDGNLTGLGNFSLSGLATLGDLVTSGRIGVTAAGDMFDWSGGTDVFIKGFSGNKIQFQIPGGTNIANFSATGLQFNTTGSQKIVDHSANTILDASGGTNLTLNAPSGSIILSDPISSSSSISASGNISSTSGSINATSGTITGGTLTSNGNINLNGTINLPVANSLSGIIKAGTYTVTTTSTAFNHGGSSTPDMIWITQAVNTSVVFSISIGNLTSTQANLQSNTTLSGVSIYSIRF